MNSTTKKIGVIALVYGSTMLLVYGASFFIVQKHSTELAEIRATTAEQTTKEIAYNSLLTILEETADDRTELASRFLSERDTVSFISTAEQDALRRGLVLETTNLAIVAGKDDELDSLTVSFKIEGPENMVKQFAALLETLPYHKRVSELSLYQQSSDTAWRSDITLHFTLMP